MENQKELIYKVFSNLESEFKSIAINKVVKQFGITKEEAEKYYKDWRKSYIDSRK